MAATTERVSQKNPAPELTTGGQHLTFHLSGETYALGILNIKEIIEYSVPTPVPMMPGFVRGVINLRGRVVPVIDMLARFGRGLTQVHKRTSIVIVEVSAFEAIGDDSSDLQHIGVMVDAVNEVVDISAKDIEPPPAFGARLRPEFISGMARREGGFVVILDVNRVLSVDEMAHLGLNLIEAPPAEEAKM
jgi:purine-binding chemotaxis protein CheW